MRIFDFKWIAPLAIIVVLVLAAGCATRAAPLASPGTSPAPTSNEPTKAAPKSAATAVPPTTGSAGITVTDAAGRQVSLARLPARIISLAPNATEIVFALGEGDKLVGVDQFSDYPDAAKKLPRMSNGFDPNNEQIIAAKPDLVLAAGITSPDAIKKLEDLKLNVLVVGAEKTSFENVMRDIKVMGQLLGAPDQAAAVVKAMQDKIASVQARVAQAKTQPRVFWELDATDPSKPYTAGPGSFVDELIAMAGGENIGKDLKSPYAQVSAEEVVSANPEVIIMSDAAYGVAPESVGKRPGWDVMDAVKNHRVFPIDDNLVSRPGPRLADGLEAAAKLIHPEAFK